MTEVEKQIAHHEKLIAENRRNAEIKRQFLEITAQQRANNELYRLEAWKLENKEKLDFFIAEKKKSFERNLKNQLASKRMEYIRHAYALGVDISVIREIFRLTDEEEMDLYSL